MRTKCYTILLLLFVVVLRAVAGGQVIIDQSGTTYVNNKRIVIGLGDEAITYLQMGTIILGKSKTKAPLLECSAILVGQIASNQVDTLNKVRNVTIINRDTIEIHSKDLVEQFGHLVKDKEHPDRPYQYIRLLGISCEGEGCQLINEGVIEFYFDHDPKTAIHVYGIGMTGKHDNTFVNRGKICFRGQGSPLTRIRGMASMWDNVMMVNDSLISVDVEMAEDTRMFTSGGEYNDIINNGTMVGRTSGTLIGMTRYGDSHITNNGVIDLTIARMPDGYHSPLAPTEKFVCGLFESLHNKRLHIAPANNKGEIRVALESADDGQWKGYGMLLNMVRPCPVAVPVNNTGTITLTQQGKADSHCMAELTAINRTKGNANILVKIGKWRTGLRDFTGQYGLFHGNHVSMDFSHAELMLENPVNGIDGKTYSMAPEALLYNASGLPSANEFIGFENMKIEN